MPSNKIQKQDLRVCLYTLFSTYGPVLDVVALKTTKMRGQAHIVFRDLHAATQAMRTLQGFDFLGRELQIQYAKSKSDTIAKLDGTFHRPAAAAGEVVATELQQSIFSGPPQSSNTNVAPDTSAAAANIKPPPAGDTVMQDAPSPAGGSVAGQKRRRDEDEEEDEEDESEGDAAMEEDSDDD